MQYHDYIRIEVQGGISPGQGGKSDVRLKGESLPVVGEVVVNVKHNKQAKDLELTIKELNVLKL